MQFFYNNKIINVCHKKKHDFLVSQICQICQKNSCQMFAKFCRQKNTKFDANSVIQWC